MSRENCLRTIIFWFSIDICFFYGGLVQGRTNNFTVPKNYDPTSTLSKALYEEGELIVRFAPNAGGSQRTVEEKNTILFGLGGGEVTRTYKMVPGLGLVKLQTGMKVEDVLADFNKSSEILYAQPNFIYKVCSTFPNDPNLSKLWGMHNAGQAHPLEDEGTSYGTPDADIDAPQAWDTTTDSDIIVAVIDTGVDYNHPDLAANMWVNEAEANGDPDVDDDDNGYVDDIYGYDFCNNDGSPMDDHYHGTHCAGTIGAVGNNGEGITGVCWNVKIMALKFADYDGYGNASDAIECIDYAVEMGAKVLSNSWGSYYYNPALLNHIEAADANGVLFIAAAGNDYGNNNDSDPVYPASFDCNNIIAVLSTDHDDDISDFSNYGASSVDLGAPGEEIHSTFPTYETIYMDAKGYSTYYETISGTSMATPHVAGACALMWSARPDLSHLEAKEYVIGSVDKLGSLDGLCVSEGRLNLNKSLKYKPPFATLTFEKEDDVGDGNCVEPCDYVTYTISYDANGTAVNDVSIIDYLPDCVEPNDPFDPNYDIVKRVYTWEIGDLDTDDSGYVSFTVQINNLAEPNGTITNFCEIKNESNYLSKEIETKICCWKADIIYVDADKWTGSDTGMSWANAYLYLQDALKTAGDCNCNEIWVAEGTYNPLTDPYDETDYFDIADGVDVYGGFAGYETSLSQRNWTENETILEGGNLNNETPTVKFYGNSGSVLDGLTITSEERAVYCNSSTVEIINSIIKDSDTGVYCSNYSSVEITNSSILGSGYGVDSDDSDLTLTKCLVKGNTSYAIFCDDSDVVLTDCNVEYNSDNGIDSYNSDLTVKNCLIDRNNGSGVYNFRPSSSLITNNIIRRNTKNGIDCNSVLSGADIKIKNNWIHDNEDDGIYIYYADPAAIIRNNTIVDSGGHGIISEDTDYVTVSNCILYGNNSGGNQLYNCTATYSCIENGGTSNGNISSDPCFIYPDDPNDYHLDPNSPCVDKGDTGPNYDVELDIDGEVREWDGDDSDSDEVDMGGDEYYWSPADYNKDEIVNFLDYAIFANAWQSENENISLDDDSDVNMIDLYHFRKDWLWQAGWEKEFSYGCTGFGGDGGFEKLAQVEQLVEKQVEAEIDEDAIKDILECIEDMWLNGDLKDTMTEERYIEFRKHLENLLNP